MNLAERFNSTSWIFQSKANGNEVEKMEVDGEEASQEKMDIDEEFQGEAIVANNERMDVDEYFESNRKPVPRVHCFDFRSEIPNATEKPKTVYPKVLGNIEYSLHRLEIFR